MFKFVSCAHHHMRLDRSESKGMFVSESRSQTSGHAGKYRDPIIIASPGLETLGDSLRKRLGIAECSAKQGKTLYLDRFKSNDVNAKFKWERINGRRVVMLFDTIDQMRFFEQLCILQALQGFAVPAAEDKATAWKTYVDSGKYSWGRAAKIQVILPWFRPCQMERTSRWQLDTQTSQWTNSDPKGQWLDIPCAQYYARLLSTPGAVPPLPGPARALDGMPLEPLWRPPLELIFIELHEEKPVMHCMTDLNTQIRATRYLPFFLNEYKVKDDYPGAANMYILFPDHGAYDRYAQSVRDVLKLTTNHILYLRKSRVGESIKQMPKLLFEDHDGLETELEKDAFLQEERVLIIDDFINSGSTLFGAVKAVHDKTKGENPMTTHIFVTHFVASYDEQVVESFRSKLHSMGPFCKVFMTNSISTTTSLLSDDPQVEVCDLSNFIAELVTKSIDWTSKL